MGYDFSVFWEVGRLFIQGGNPYAISVSFYPPVAVYFFALISLIPQGIGYLLFTGVNAVLLLLSAGKLDKSNLWLWFFYPPAMFIFATGQLDIVFLYFSTLLLRGGIMAAVGGSLLTIKPQLAFIVLPWFIIRWAKSDRNTLVKWFIFTILLHGIPLVIHPHLYSEWLSNANASVSWRLNVSPGVFSLGNFNVPIIILAAIAILLAFWGLFKKRETSITTQLMALPVGIWYSNIFTIGTAPKTILIPVGVIASIIVVLTKNSFPFFFITLTAFIYRMIKERKKAPSF